MSGDQGWLLFDYRGMGIWPEAWPPVAYRWQGDDHIILRITPGKAQANRIGAVHGGFLATLAENSLQLPIEHRAESSVTISMSLDYPASARIDVPLEGEVRIIRETGKLVFVTVAFAQAGETVIHGSGIIRKLLPQ